MSPALTQEDRERLKLIALGLDEVPELAADAPFLRNLAKAPEPATDEQVGDEAVEQMAAEQGPRWPTRKAAWLDGFRHGEQHARLTGAAFQAAAPAIEARAVEAERQRLLGGEAFHDLASSVGRARVLIGNLPADKGREVEAELAAAASSISRLRAELSERGGGA